MKNADFLELFKIAGSIDSQPQLDLRSLKLIKANFIDVFIDWNVVQSIGNSAWILASWIDAILEFTVLKHEVIYLSAKKE